MTFALLDIERRRQAEVSIAQAQASLQRIIETAPLAIALFDARSQRVLQVNQMARPSSAGRPSSWWAARRGDWIAGARRPRCWRRPARGAAANEVLRRELRLDGAAGARLWDTRFVSLPTSAGAREQVLLVASDVTEQRAEAQARFEAAIAQREMLVKEVHHRIKNNLQGVAGLLQQNAARHPEVAAILTDRLARCRPSPRSTGCRSAPAGRCAWPACCRRSRCRCSAPSAARCGCRC